MAAEAAFGMTAKQAKEQGICISCKRSIEDIDMTDPMDHNEYSISALCPECFEDITKPDDE